MVVSDDELVKISKNIGTTKAKTLFKHSEGDGHSLSSQKALSTLPVYSKIEIVLDYNPRKELKRLGILD